MWRKVLIYGSCILTISSCSQQTKDKGIKQIIGTEAQQEVAFAGVNYSIENGVVTLTGTCATEQEKAKVESTVKQTAGVKSVQNLITVAPVVLNGGHLLKKAVDSVLMKYPTVNANVQDSIIYLQGQVEHKKQQKIITALQGLGAKGIANQLQTSSIH